MICFPCSIQELPCSASPPRTVFGYWCNPIPLLCLWKAHSASADWQKEAPWQSRFQAHQWEGLHCPAGASAGCSTHWSRYIPISAGKTGRGWNRAGQGGDKAGMGGSSFPLFLSLLLLIPYCKAFCGFIPGVLWAFIGGSVTTQPDFLPLPWPFITSRTSCEARRQEGMPLAVFLPEKLWMESAHKVCE